MNIKQRFSSVSQYLFMTDVVVLLHNLVCTCCSFCWSAQQEEKWFWLKLGKGFPGKTVNQHMSFWVTLLNTHVWFQWYFYYYLTTIMSYKQIYGWDDWCCCHFKLSVLIVKYNDKQTTILSYQNWQLSNLCSTYCTTTKCRKNNIM